MFRNHDARQPDRTPSLYSIGALTGQLGRNFPPLYPELTCHRLTLALNTFAFVIIWTLTHNQRQHADCTSFQSLRDR